jgi:mannosyltransferase
VVLVAAILAGIAMRFVIRFDQGFWEDEIIAVTHAVQPLPGFFVESIRDDTHPPLYFLQLHFWSWVSQADLWFIGNSILWGLIALLSLWAVQRRIRGTAIAWTSVAFLAVLPAGLWMSQEVRPYAWLSVLFIWTCDFAERCFGTSEVRSRDQWILFLLCLATIYSHAIGFYAILFNGLYALSLLLRRPVARSELWRFIRIYGLSAVLGFPLLASDLIRDAGLHQAGSWMRFLAWTAGVVTIGSPPRLAGGCAYFAVVLAGIAVARTRLLTVCFLIAPLLVALGLELILAPIFKANFFAAMMAPFMAVVLGEVSFALRPRLGRPAITIALCVLAVMAVIGWAGKSRSTDFLPAATDIMAAMRPGDVVYVPQGSMFWGMAWYLGGPNWGSALDVGGTPSAKMQRAFGWLPPTLVAELHLMPKTHSVSLPNGLVLVAGSQRDPAVENASRVWLVTYPRGDLPAGMPPPRLGSLSRKSEHQYSELVVSRYE